MSTKNKKKSSTMKSISAYKGIAEKIVDIGQKKTKLPISKMLLLGLLAGAFIAFAGQASNMATHTIQSVGEESGFIRLTTDIPLDANVFITYRYEEDFYTYRDIYVNSTVNPNILHNSIVV